MKKVLVLALAVLVAAGLFSCSPSPAALEVGGRKVDASEYAYYLHYNFLNLSTTQQAGAPPVSPDELLQKAKEQAESQIVTAEVIRILCDQLELELDGDLKKQMEEDKEALIDSFGGMAGYLDFLEENAMTDRLYDKLQENAQYYVMLHEHINSGEAALSQNDQALRQFFSENYIKVKYIRLGTLDETGTLRPAAELETLHTQAKDILTQIQSGELEFDYAVAQYNDDSAMTDRPTGIVVNVKGGSAAAAYAADAAELDNGAIGGVYTYNDGYYILQRLSVDAGYFDENREQISLAAGDWAFTDAIDQAKANIKVTVNSVCKKINFANMLDYIK